ncbi:glycosyltransferase [Marinobacter sp. NP-4(2019)]|uniref:glycosyltransferase family 2 protein n=1 Tax=Marinobacter sp. NP-4(2019) TaxID=2488665 RepID=UPI000FC3EEA3|nr:glycosyltransferase [Marinobacter sp. NP-4(2019)]AZT84550.1 glycosyltransferase [Marinobacter sp. NP-4(2019)]
MYEVTIIIPVFNDQLGLNKCLQAIDDQQGVDLSLVRSVVVDNGSRPHLVLPKGLKHSVSLFRCETPGSYAARNFGVRHSSGGVLAFIDADCWPHENWLSEGLKLLSETEYSAVIGGEVTFEPSGHPTGTELYQLMMGFGQQRCINTMGFTATANLFVSRKLFELAGPFDETLYSCGDREWVWRAADHGICVKYAGKSIVYTHPRRSLKGAIIQARRVAGGRHILKKMLHERGQVQVDMLNRQKGIRSKSASILNASGYSLRQRLSAFIAASLIRCAHDFERIRIILGSEPERR